MAWRGITLHCIAFAFALHCIYIYIYVYVYIYTYLYFTYSNTHTYIHTHTHAFNVFCVLNTFLLERVNKVKHRWTNGESADCISHYNYLPFLFLFHISKTLQKQRKLENPKKYVYVQKITKIQKIQKKCEEVENKIKTITISFQHQGFHFDYVHSSSHLISCFSILHLLQHLGSIFDLCA